MLIKKLLPGWDNTLKGAAVGIFCMTVGSAAWAALCPIGYSGAECEDIPQYTANNPGTTNPPIEADCERMGYKYRGAQKGTEAWPSMARVDGRNNTEQYNCEICTADGGPVLDSLGYARWNCWKICEKESEALNINGGYGPIAGWDSTYKHQFVNTQKQCTDMFGKNESGTPNRVFTPITATVCGTCEEYCDGITVTTDGKKPAPINPEEKGGTQYLTENGRFTDGCFYPCTDANTDKDKRTGVMYKKVGEYQCCNAKYWKEMTAVTEDCPNRLCEHNGVAEFDAARRQNDCTGWAWNDHLASAVLEKSACSCVSYPCHENSEIIPIKTDGEGNAILDDNGHVIPQNDKIKLNVKTGVYTINKDGVCYKKVFENWSGNDACYKDELMTEADKQCNDGEEFNEEECECIPLKCPDGWSIYAQVVEQESLDYADGHYNLSYTLKEDTSRMLFGDEPNATLNLEQASVTAADNCGKIGGSGHKGWKVVYEQDGKTYRSVKMDANGRPIKNGNRYDIYQCGMCQPKECPKDEADESKNTAIAENCGGYDNKLDPSVLPTEFYAGERMCYACSWCMDVESHRNTCYAEIINQNLVSCWGEDRTGDTLVPVCQCNEINYYKRCWMLKPSDTCSYFSFAEEEGCDLVLLNKSVTAADSLKGTGHGGHGTTTSGHGGAILPGSGGHGNLGVYKFTGTPPNQTMTVFNLSGYNYPYAISRCQYAMDSQEDWRGYVVAYVAECAAEHTCEGHGPAWNPDANGGNGAAMVVCDKNQHQYGVMDEGRSAVNCGGKTWYDRCETAMCSPDPNGPDAVKCVDGSTRQIVEQSVSYSSNLMGKLYSSDGNGKYYSRHVCSYNGDIGIEQWYIEDCDARSTCDGSEAPGWDSANNIARIRYQEGKGWLCKGSQYICGTRYGDRVVFYDAKVDGEDNCKSVGDMPGFGNTPCNGYCDGETVKDTDGNTWCNGACIMNKCRTDEKCNGEVKDGYCLGTCEKYACAKVTNISENGCLSDPYASSDTNLQWGTYAGSGNYVVKKICPTEGELEPGDKAKYARATCNVEKDCSGKPGPAFGKIDYCPYHQHFKDGANCVECGGTTWCDPADCEEDVDTTPVESCPTNVAGLYVTQGTDVPGGYEDTNVTCTMSGDTWHYYIPCNTEQITFRVNGNNKTVHGSLPGYSDCGEEGNDNVRARDPKTCGGHIFGKNNGSVSGCEVQCNYDWDKATCEGATYEQNGVICQGSYIPSSECSYGSCEFCGMVVGSKDAYSEVIDGRWCTAADPNRANHNCNFQ